MRRVLILKTTRIRWLAAVALAVGVAGCTPSGENPVGGDPVGGDPVGENESTSRDVMGEKGVVVEEVTEGSALDRAGLRPGDVVLAWERLPALPANPQRAQGTIESVFDWKWLRTEQAPRGTVLLTARRGKVYKVIKVEPGEWKTTLRPVMPQKLLRAFVRGKELVEDGDLDAGIDYWRNAANLPGDEHLTCWILFHIGGAWERAGDWGRADAAYHAALATTQKPLVKFEIWRTLGDVSAKASKYPTARKAYEAAMEIAETEWGENLIFSQSLNILGILDWRQGKLEASQRLWQRALAINKKLAPASLPMAAILNNLGILASDLGYGDRATEYYEASLEIRQNLAPGSLAIASILNNLGIMASDRGDFGRAAEYHEKVLEIYQELDPGSVDVATSLDNLGNLASYRGDRERAADYYEQSLEIQQASTLESLDMAVSLNSLGNLAFDRGDRVQAIKYFEESLKLGQKLAPDSLGVATSLSNLGFIAFDRGDLNRAAEYHEASREIRQKLAPDSEDMADSLYNFGFLSLAHGDLDSAAEYFVRSLEIQQRLAPHTFKEALRLHAMGIIRREQEQPQKALDFFLKALQALEHQDNRLGGSRNTQAIFRANHLAYYRDAIDLSLKFRQLEKAFHILERSRARGFLAQLAERDLVFADVPEDLAQQRRRIAQSYDRDQAEIAKLNPRDHFEEVEALRTRLQQLRWDFEDVTRKVIKASPKQRALRYPKPLDVDAARQALDPGTLMLSYSVGPNATHLFILAPEEELQVETVLFGEKDLQEEIRNVLALQKRILPSLYTDPMHQAGERLYRALIRPAEEAIARSERVLIVPDGPLHLLPFALLNRKTHSGKGHRERESEYLVEQKPLHSALSATVYAELKDQRQTRTREASEVLALAAFGDPLYSPRKSGQEFFTADRSLDVYVRAAARRGFDFRPLPYSREEVNRISAFYPRGAVSAFVGTEATEEQAKSIGKSARILHFATHGRFDDRIPMNSYLAMTIPKEFRKNQDNGLLQAWEIFEDVRLDADLVVLSACESGLGDELDGEGLIGLTRAFQFAGARTVVSSLWQVDDQATTELMVRFYRHLLAGASKDEALRAAQLEFIRGPVEMKDSQGRIVERDLSIPYYWAAFQLNGDWK